MCGPLGSDEVLEGGRTPSSFRLQFQKLSQLTLAQCDKKSEESKADLDPPPRRSYPVIWLVLKITFTRLTTADQKSTDIIKHMMNGLFYLSFSVIPKNQSLARQVGVRGEMPSYISKP